MAIIDLVSWSPQGNETIYAYRFPETNLSTYTQLVVQESQEAVLFSKGQIFGKFGPGKHTLNTENIPILRNLYGIPFGGKNPFTAEVWFINKTTPYNIDWQTDSMSIHDADYNTQLPLVSKGRYGLKISDSEKFLIKIVGTRSMFTQHHLTDQFLGEFTTMTKSTIAQFMNTHRIGLKSIAAHLADLSKYLKNAMSEFWDNIGLDLTQFYITSIEIDTTTPTGREVAKAISEQSAMYITGHTWQQAKMFDVANNAVDSLNTGNGGLLGGLLAINMMGGLGGGGAAISGGMMHPQYNQPTFGRNNQGHTESHTQQTREIYCSRCSKKFPGTAKYCPHCGDPNNPCPKCGTDNSLNAKRCVSCRTDLTATKEEYPCTNCNTPLLPGTTFCGNCGQQSVSGDNCGRCRMPIDPGVKYCPNCGYKR